MRSSIYIAAAVLLAVVSLSRAAPKPDGLGHHLVKRSLELRYGSSGGCQMAAQQIVGCSRTLKSNTPETEDPEFVEKACRELKTFYDCGVSAMTNCNDFRLQTALDKLDTDGRQVCPNEFGADSYY